MIEFVTLLQTRRRSHSHLTIFPDDENGRVLRNIAARGDDLTKARNIDFTVVFAQATSAEQFAEHFRGLGHKVTVEETGTEEGHPWDVVVVKHMVPTYEGITDFENDLQFVADRWGGYNVYSKTTGWGFFNEPIEN